MTNQNSRTGFTLIELLVVIAIISLLVSILLPSLSRAKELAKRAVCMSNLKHIGTAVHMYVADLDKFPTPYHGINPPPAEGDGWQQASMAVQLYPEYLSAGLAFVCPSSELAGIDPTASDAPSIHEEIPNYPDPQWYLNRTSYTWPSNELTHDCPEQVISYDYVYLWGNHVGGFSYVYGGRGEFPGKNCLLLSGAVEWYPFGEPFLWGGWMWAGGGTTDNPGWNLNVE